MDKIHKLINSLYLGDRFCENVSFLQNKIIIQMNCISRIKKGSDTWNFYTDEDIQHGKIVFDDVTWYHSDSELIFNDAIYEIKVTDYENDIFLFTIYGSNVSEKAVSTDVELKIKAKRFYIINPKDNSIILN